MKDYIEYLKKVMHPSDKHAILYLEGPFLGVKRIRRLKVVLVG